MRLFMNFELSSFKPWSAGLAVLESGVTTNNTTADTEAKTTNKMKTFVCFSL